VLADLAALQARFISCLPESLFRQSNCSCCLVCSSKIVCSSLKDEAVSAVDESVRSGVLLLCLYVMVFC